MHKYLFMFILLSFSMIVNANPNHDIAVFPLNTAKLVMVDDQAKQISNAIITELRSRANINVIVGVPNTADSDMLSESENQRFARLGRSLNVEFVIFGDVEKVKNETHLNVKMLNVSTGAELFSGRMSLQKKDKITDKIPIFCSQIVANLPKPNLFIGKWRAVAERPATNYSEALTGGELIIFFFKDGTVHLEKYIQTPVKTFYDGSGAYSYTDDSISIKINLSDGSIIELNDAYYITETELIIDSNSLYYRHDATGNAHYKKLKKINN